MFIVKILQQKVELKMHVIIIVNKVTSSLNTVHFNAAYL